MGTLKIGSASNKAGVTIDPRTVLFNDNNVKYIKSGLTEIWSNIKALVPILTSNNGSDGGEVIYDSQYNTTRFNAYYAFANYDPTDDSSNSKYFSSGDSNFPHYLGYDFKIPTIVKRFTIYPGKNNGMSRIKDYSIQGYNGATWVDIYTSSLPNEIKLHDIVFENDTPYVQYRIYVTSTYSSDKLCSIRTLQFYGTKLKGILVPMNTYSNDIGTVSASSEYNSANTLSYCSIDDYATNKYWYTSASTTSIGEYIQFMFNKPTRINAFRFRFGTPHSDPFTTKVKVQYTLNGNDWLDVENSEKEYSGRLVSERFFIDCNLTNVIGIRITNTYKSKSCIFSVADIQVYK